MRNQPLFETAGAYVPSEPIPYPKAWITLGASAAFVAGIFCADLGIAGGALLIAAGAGAAAMAFLLPLLRMPRMLAALFAGMFLFGAFYLPFSADFRLAGANFPPHGAAFAGTAINEPQVTAKTKRFTLKLALPYRGEVAIVADRNVPVSYGDVVAVSGAVTVDSATGLGTALFPNIKVTGRSNAWPMRVRSALIGIKMALVRGFPKLFGADEAALLEGITVGVRSGFSQNFKSEMAAAGVTHLVALSGYNISILVLALSALLSGFLARRARFWTTLVIIAAFVLMVGAGASIIRAALMGALLLVAEESGRSYYPAAAIALAAALMLLWDPTMLADVGFELSFLALLGIIYLKPAIEDALGIRQAKDDPHPFRETALTTLAAQLAVIPVLIGTFGQFSFASILANVLILGLIPFTMLLGFIIGAAGMISYYLAFALAKFTGILLVYEVAVISFFAKIQIPLGVSFDSWLTIGAYYVLLVGFIYAARRIPPVAQVYA